MRAIAFSVWRCSSVFVNRYHETMLPEFRKCFGGPLSIEHNKQREFFSIGWPMSAGPADYPWRVNSNSLKMKRWSSGRGLAGKLTVVSLRSQLGELFVLRPGNVDRKCHGNNPPVHLRWQLDRETAAVDNEGYLFLWDLLLPWKKRVQKHLFYPETLSRTFL